MRSGGSFEVTLTEDRPGFTSLLIEGEAQEFLDEAGGHRWQRIPPTEKRGRTQTSTVTVAVFELRDELASRLNLRDVDIQTTRGSGPGGQHRNTTDSCVVATHKPTGLSVRIDGRSQIRNRKVALDLLAVRIAASALLSAKLNQDANRKNQVGSGQRGDKIRTYRVRDNIATDHRTAQRWPLDKWLDGIR